jgi:hypothetical protein
MKKRSHNHNHNQTNPKPQPKPKIEPKKQPPNVVVHTKNPQPQQERKNTKKQRLADPKNKQQFDNLRHNQQPPCRQQQETLKKSLQRHNN